MRSAPDKGAEMHMQGPLVVDRAQANVSGSGEDTRVRATD